MRTELFVTTLIDTWIPGERVVDRAGCWGTPPRRVAGAAEPTPFAPVRAHLRALNTSGYLCRSTREAPPGLRDAPAGLRDERTIARATQPRSVYEL